MNLAAVHLTATLIQASTARALAQDWPDRTTLPIPLAPFEGCPYRKSNPNVLVMEPTKEWNGLDAPDSLHCPADRRILAQR